MKKILVVDDDSDILLIVEGILTSAGYEAVSTSQPGELREILEQERVDAVILDIFMPGVSGFDLLREIRADERWRELPVLMLSASTESGQRVRGFREGANDFMAKPFDGFELVSRIDRLVPRNSEGASLAGDLSGFAVPELLQNLQRNRQTGRLFLSGLPGEAVVEFRSGEIVGASYGRLEPYDSLLAMISSSGGTFRFCTEEVPQADQGSIHVQGLLLDAAWLEDELGNRRQHLPGEAQSLRVKERELPEIPGDLDGIPVNAVFDLLASLPAGASLSRLISAEIAAPVRTRLAVAVLLESGAVVTGSGRTERLPSARPGRDSAPNSLARLIDQAARRGFAPPVRLLLVALPTAWPSVIEFLHRIPAELLPKERQKLLEQVASRGGGVVRLNGPEGVVMLSVQKLRLGSEVAEPPLLRIAAGTLLWLGDRLRSQEVEVVLGGLELAPEKASGVIVDPARLLDQERPEIKRSRWRFSNSAPESFGALGDLLFAAD